MAAQPELPLDSLRIAAGDSAESHAALADFHSELTSDQPDSKRLETHASRIRALPNIVGPFERWWLSPRVQAFIAELNATGI
jgi:hypothetical protein